MEVVTSLWWSDWWSILWFLTLSTTWWNTAVTVQGKHLDWVCECDCIHARCCSSVCTVKDSHVFGVYVYFSVCLYIFLCVYFSVCCRYLCMCISIPGNACLFVQSAFSLEYLTVLHHLYVNENATHYSLCVCVCLPSIEFCRWQSTDRMFLWTSSMGPGRWEILSLRSSARRARFSWSCLACRDGSADVSVEDTAGRDPHVKHPGNALSLFIAKTRQQID